MTKSARTLFALRRVTGHSMEPTLRPGTIVLAVCVGRLRTGQIIVFRHNGLEKIKRITKLRPGQVYVAGDNAAHSTDSRDFGWIDTRQVIGRIVWPRRK